MRKRSTELSSAAILGIAAIVAIVGLAVYFIATPLTPSQRVALGHAAVSETVMR
jgi:hypothetical protein